MSAISRTRASLRFFGDQLDPEAVSTLLGASPTSGAKKGGVWITKRGVERTARTGFWLLQADPRRPGDLDSQIADLLSPLTADTAIWQRLVAKCKADIFCGLFMEESNEGLELRPETLALIGSRGLSLGFDMYCQAGEEAGELEGGVS